LNVYSVIGDWPSTIHLVTNIGIYIFRFNANLTDREDIYYDGYSILSVIKT